MRVISTILSYSKNPYASIPLHRHSNSRMKEISIFMRIMANDHTYNSLPSNSVPSNNNKNKSTFKPFAFSVVQYKKHHPYTYNRCTPPAPRPTASWSFNSRMSPCAEKPLAYWWNDILADYTGISDTWWSRMKMLMISFKTRSSKHGPILTISELTARYRHGFSELPSMRVSLSLATNRKPSPLILPTRPLYPC